MESQRPPRAKWSKTKRIIVIAVAAVVLSTTPAFVSLFIQVHEANKALASFGAALVAKNYGHAYELTSTEFQAVMAETVFANQQKVLCSNLGDLREVRRGAFDTKEEGDGWTSDITTRFIFARAERVFDFKMKKQGPEWKIFGYSER